MKDSRFGLHFQRIPSWASERVLPMDLEWNKIVDPPIANPFPGKKIIGRIYHEEGKDNDLIMVGAAGGAEYFAQCASTYYSSTYVSVWEGPNEPPVRTAVQREMLSKFTLRWIELMHKYGFRTAALSLSVGWPDIGTAQSFAKVVEETDYLSLHEYSAPQMQSSEGYHCLRYRNTVKELAEVGIMPPKIFITEAGIDGGVIPGGARKGWRTYANGRQDYFDQLLWYDSELKKDPYVIAFTPFTSGPYPDWTDFNFDEDLVEMLATYLETVIDLPENPAESPVPVPVPIPVIPVEEIIRKACWDRQNISYNPAAALQKAAAEEFLMAPIGPEFDIDGYRVQAYADGIVYCKIGHWDDVRLVFWDKARR